MESATSNKTSKKPVAAKDPAPVLQSAPAPQQQLPVLSTPTVPVPAPMPSFGAIAMAASAASVIAASATASSDESGFGEKIAALKAEIADMTARNKVTKGQINKFTDDFSAEHGRKPTKDDRRLYAKDMFSNYHRVSEHIYL